MTITVRSTRPPMTTLKDEAITEAKTPLLSPTFFPQLSVYRVKGSTIASKTTPNQNGIANTPVVIRLIDSDAPGNPDLESQKKYIASTTNSIAMITASTLTICRTVSPCVFHMRFIKVATTSRAAPVEIAEITNNGGSMTVEAHNG